MANKPRPATKAPASDKSILDWLGNQDTRVLSVERLPDGKLRFFEECDHYFYEDLSPDEVRQLCAELLALLGPAE